MRKFFTMALASLMLGSLMVSCGDNQPKLDPANPFAKEWVEFNGMPPFNLIKISDILPALKVGIAQESLDIDKITKNSEAPTFENTILAFQNTGKLLGRVGTAYGALNSTEKTDELKAIQEEYTKLSSEHSSNISLNAELFNRIKAVYDSRNDGQYDAIQIRLIEKTYDRFARNGANLSVEDKEKIRKINSELSELSMKYGNALLNETNAYKLIVENEADLAGLPEGNVAAAAATAKKDGMEGKWVFTLSNSSYMPFMKYAKNRDLRKQMFEAYSNRGNNNNADDTKEIIKKIIKLRIEKAKLFGFETFADYNLDNSVAKTPENVMAFIESVWTPIVTLAKKEVKDMQSVMTKDGINDKIQPWDWFYYAEKVRTAKYDLSETEIKPYLEVNQVRDGALAVATKLFGITFKQVEGYPIINPETQVFEVSDKDGSFLSVLTFDFFPRSTKAGGAWCSRLKGQEYVDGKRVAPIVTITCNFTPAVGDTPSLLTMDEATTLFHEFGHALQGMFTDLKYKGLTGNPRDFVEFPSQIMEFWTFNPEVLKTYAKHYQTGEVIPDNLIAKIQKSGTFNQGFVTGENLAASYLDMAFHSINSPEMVDSLDVIAFEKEALAKLGAIDEFVPRYRTTYFNHIWASGYAAGYYSYKWADVMSADGFAAFSETGDIYNPEVAQRLRDLVFSQGSAKDEMEMYKEWRGAEPDSKYLMKALGLN